MEFWCSDSTCHEIPVLLIYLLNFFLAFTHPDPLKATTGRHSEGCLLPSMCKCPRRMSHLWTSQKHLMGHCVKKNTRLKGLALIWSNRVPLCSSCDLCNNELQRRTNYFRRRSRGQHAKKQEYVYIKEGAHENMGRKVILVWAENSNGVPDHTQV